MKSRQARIALAVVIVLVAGLLLRNPIRKFIKRQNPKPAGTGLFDDPEALAIDSAGNLYVGDENRGEFTMLDPAGKILARFKDVEGYVDGEGRPAHITRGLVIVPIAPGHVVLVGSHNLAELRIDGGKPTLVRLIGKRGSGPGEMNGPEGLARDANGDLYATDEHNRRINVFDKDGKFLREMKTAQDPQALTIWKDRLYVSINKRHYIACWTRDGREQFRIGRASAYPILLAVFLPLGLVALGIFRKRFRFALGAMVVCWGLGGAACGIEFWLHTQPGQFQLPDAMTVSPDGTSLYIADRRNGRVQVFDLDGRFKFAFGEFRDPKGIVFDAQGNVLVADSDNHRIQVLTPEGKVLRSIE